MKKITRGSHFLPKNAYLCQFRNNHKQVFQYTRDKEPFLISLNDAAKKRDLYNFTNEQGAKDDEIEKFLQKIEDQAAPTIKSLATASSLISLKMQDKESLAISFQNSFSSELLKTPHKNKKPRKNYEPKNQQKWWKHRQINLFSYLTPLGHGQTMP